MSSIVALLNKDKYGDFKLNLFPPNKAVHSFIVTCSFSNSHFGSRLVAFKCQAMAKEIHYVVLYPLVANFLKALLSAPYMLVVLAHVYHVITRTSIVKMQFIDS
jgi:hypothetical protein